MLIKAATFHDQLNQLSSTPQQFHSSNPPLIWSRSFLCFSLCYCIRFEKHFDNGISGRVFLIVFCHGMLIIDRAIALVPPLMNNGVSRMFAFNQQRRGADTETFIYKLISKNVVTVKHESVSCETFQIITFLKKSIFWMSKYLGYVRKGHPKLQPPCLENMVCIQLFISHLHDSCPR